jgi:DNA repair protein RadC
MMTHNFQTEAGKLSFKAVATGSPARPMRGCSPAQVQGFWHDNVACAPWFDAEKETLVALLLDPQSRLIGWHLVGIGSAREVPVSMRDAFRPAIVAQAAGVVFCHNHPSCRADPSGHDIEVTRRLQCLGATLGIRLVDHVILTPFECQSVIADLW